MTAAGRLHRLDGTADGGVVALGAPGGEHDLGRLGAEQRGHRGPRVVEHRLGLLAEMVHARRVAPGVAGDGDEAIEGRGHQRRRRVVVQVYARHCADRNIRRDPWRAQRRPTAGTTCATGR